MGTELASSPRISFCHDLPQSVDNSPIDQKRQDGSLPVGLEAAQFDFSISIEVSAQDPSPADEIFSDGKILPIPIRSSRSSVDAAPSSPRKEEHHHPPVPPHSPVLVGKKWSLRELMGDVQEEDGRAAVRTWAPPQSLWRFGRSSSVGPAGRSKTGMICPFPLARSRSTGSPRLSSQIITRNPSAVQSIPRRQSSSSCLTTEASCPNGLQVSYCRGSTNNDGVPAAVPAPFSPRGRTARSNAVNSSRTRVLACLLCNCNDKSCAVTCSP